MGVDYDANFGIGVKVNIDEVQDLAEERGYDDWSEYLEEIFQNTFYQYGQVGSLYTDDWHLIIVINKPVRDIASDFEKHENDLIAFLRQHQVTAKSELGLEGGVFVH